MINRELFYKIFKQTPELDFLFDKIDKSETINRLSWVAYILATIKHETANTFKPITELGSQKYLTQKRYYPYIGRGYVQLTWDFNYRKFGKLLNIPLLEHPELANEPETAWKILEVGMVQGLYTGKKLSDYLNDTEMDFYNARKIINGLDQATTIKFYAGQYFQALEWIDQARAVNGKDTEHEGGKKAT